MIEWMPIPDEPPSDGADYLLWCPELRVSGPVVVAYVEHGAWHFVMTGNIIIPETPPTHYARINPPEEINPPEDWPVEAA